MTQLDQGNRSWIWFQHIPTHPNYCYISPIRHMCCKMYTRHRQRSIHGGSSTYPRGMPHHATMWSIPSRGGCVYPPCVGVGGVLLPPPSPPMRYRHSLFPGACELPEAGQGCVALPSDRGYYLKFRCKLIRLYPTSSNTGVMLRNLNGSTINFPQGEWPRPRVDS